MSAGPPEQFEEGLESFLKGRAAIAAIVGGDVYPDDEVPQKNAGYPRVTYSVDSTDGTSSTQGDSGLDHVTFTLSCQARNRLDAALLSRAVRGEMRDVRGPVGQFKVQGGVEFENRSYATVNPPDGGEDMVNIVDLTFSAWVVTPLALPRGVT